MQKKNYNIKPCDVCKKTRRKTCTIISTENRLSSNGTKIDYPIVGRSDSHYSNETYQLSSKICLIGQTIKPLDTKMNKI